MVAAILKGALLLLGFYIPSLNGQNLDANGVSLTEKWEHMERLMLEEGNLKVAISSCDTFLGDSKGPKTGHQTTAEWLRLVFHDAVTANVAAGTGGLDASIGFESHRAENIGISFVNDTLLAFNRVYSVMTSMSDIIGLGLMLSLIVCDPSLDNQRLLKLRVGRKDATGAGPVGVPEPADSLSTILADFARAGFNQSEAIASVTCGHSLGSVNTIDFPDIIPASAITDDNTRGTVAFDSTKAVFDNRQVIDYLDNTGSRGGPLVVGNNATTRSDLRLFVSDNNSTMRSLRSASAFQDRCFTLFEKMMDTVPRGTVLSDVVKPRPWSMERSWLDLYPDGVVSYEGVIKGLSKDRNLPNTVSYQYTTQGGGNTGTKTSQFQDGYGSSLGFGNTKTYDFKDNITSTSVTGIRVQNSYSAPLSLDLFVIKSQSFITPDKVVVRVAVRSSLASTTATLVATNYYNTPQIGSIAPKIAKSTVNLTYKKTSGAYKIFQGVLGFTSGERAGGDGYVDVKFGSLVSPKIGSFGFNWCELASPINC